MATENHPHCPACDRPVFQCECSPFEPALDRLSEGLRSLMDIAIEHGAPEDEVKERAAVIVSGLMRLANALEAAGV